MQDPQKEIFAFKGTESTTHKFYSERGLDYYQAKVQLVTLAKCLLLAFEKAINVHFLQHQNKLSKNEFSHFFIKDNEITTNCFEEDQKLANWWFSLTDPIRENHLEKAKDLEKRIVLDHNKLKNVD